MRISNKILMALASLLFSISVCAQKQDGELGSWFVYTFNSDFDNSLWGINGDIQYRNWNVTGLTQQLLIRGGGHFTPKNSRFKFTLGYAYISSHYRDNGEFKNSENRIYQEIRYPSKLGERLYLVQRVRIEQRFIQNENFRTRFRYSLGIDLPLNHRLLIKNTWFVSFYDEVFFNGQKEISDTENVDIFDRNRLYLSLGYVFSAHLKMSLGFLNQVTTETNKNQLTLTVAHTF
ncbi:DUF2490 domain-containing protein [Formosa sp. A9]|uniref:DUF2490 domain-containing protein n=1 Tax=Formosa sp. A9 TaxID=3442641 RepID=UPI003EB732DB